MSDQPERSVGKTSLGLDPEEREQLNAVLRGEDGADRKPDRKSGSVEGADQAKDSTAQGADAGSSMGALVPGSVDAEPSEGAAGTGDVESSAAESPKDRLIRGAVDAADQAAAAAARPSAATESVPGAVAAGRADAEPAETALPRGGADAESSDGAAARGSDDVEASAPTARGADTAERSKDAVSLGNAGTELSADAQAHGSLDANEAKEAGSDARGGPRSHKGSGGSVAEQSEDMLSLDDAATPADVLDAGAARTEAAANDPDAPPGSVTPDTVAEFTLEALDDDEFRSALEAMLLVVDAPAPVEQLAAALDDSAERVEGVLREVSAELSARGSGIDLRFVGDGWRFYTRSEYAPYVERVLLDGARTKLTRAALETLAVIAYRQPVTRTRVSAVRGVNVDGVMRTLLARGLIAEAGVDPETNGTRYATTELFLERIGLASLTDLPPLAPLLPGVDLIDEINDSLETDPRYTRQKKPAVSDLDLGTED